ncbi:MAG: type II secretion system protein GspD, partial [Planctomycetota bacterium]
MRQIKENPNIKNTLPEIYKRPPRKVKTEDGVLLFYFTKHHSVERLAQLFNEEFGVFPRNSKGQILQNYRGLALTDPAGNPLRESPYPIAMHHATNQLIIRCNNEKEADTFIEFLELVDVPPIQVNIDCLILERFADIAMDWETTLKIENLLGEKVTLGDSKYPKAAFPGASLRESKRSEFGLDFGYLRNEGISGHEFRVMVDMLISRGYLKVLLNPTIETVNGQRAEIVSKEFVPIEKIVTARGVEPYSITEYKWVEDKLEVTPHVYADGSIGLDTRIVLGSKSKPEGVVQSSIITERSIDVNENRIKPGESLFIGGIRKTEERAVIRGIPFFKDIPIIGILFSSKDFEEKATEVIFVLTPSISSGGIEHIKMIEEVRKRYARPEYQKGISDILADPFGTGAYKEYLELEADKARFDRFKMELEKQQAMEDVLTEKAKTEKAHIEVKKAKREVVKTKAAAKKFKTEAEEARAEAEKAVIKAQKAIERFQKIKAKTIQKAAPPTTKKAPQPKAKATTPPKKTTETKKTTKTTVQT